MAIYHLLSGYFFLGLVKVSSLQDLLSSEILSLLGKTGIKKTVNFRNLEDCMQSVITYPSN